MIRVSLLRPLSVLATVALLSLAGCATYKPISLEKVPDLIGIDIARGPAPAYRDAITAAPVSGGKDGSIFSIPHLSNAEFQQSLERTLQKARLASASIGRFRLDAALKLDQPLISMNTTVTASIAYRLTEVATGAVVYDRTLVTQGTVSYFDMNDGPDRMKYANWRAVVANLRQLVQELYDLPDR
jgi:hypothetical protein